MIVYNVTIKVDVSIHTEWIKWLKEVHIPDVINTRCFTHAIILKLMETDEMDGITYAIQYHAENEALYKKYIRSFASSMRQKATDKWGDKFIAWRTVMHIV